MRKQIGNSLGCRIFGSFNKKLHRNRVDFTSLQFVHLTLTGKNDVTSNRMQVSFQRKLFANDIAGVLKISFENLLQHLFQFFFEFVKSC